MKKILQIIGYFVVLIPVVFVLVQGVNSVSQLSNRDVKQFSYGSLGDPVPIERGPIVPALALDGQIIANVTKSHRISKCEQPALLVSGTNEVSIGDEIISCLNKTVLATFNGVIVDIQLGEQVVITYNDSDELRYNISILKKDLEKYTKDFKNDDIELIVEKVSKKMSEEGTIDIVYEVKSSDKTDLFIDEKTRFYFFEENAIEDQILVPKSAVFENNQKQVMRFLEEDGTIIGDIEVNILFESQSQFAISFGVDNDYKFYDWTYGQYKNSLSLGKSNE